MKKTRKLHFPRKTTRLLWRSAARSSVLEYKRAGIKVDDLSVAFAADRAYLSGLTTSEVERVKAVAVARDQPGVRNTGSSILVITEEQRQEWLNSKDDED